MRRVAGVLCCVAMVTAAACDGGSPKFAGDPPSAAVAYGSCTFCHGDLSQNMFDTGGHGSVTMRCETCHDDLLPNDPGPGHRAVPVCADCHDSQQTHADPDLNRATECVVCHTPHGSDNLFLINEVILTPFGEDRDVIFDNLDGLADGSFASVSDPGSVLCETCHTETRYYRSDGSGGAHFPFSCFTCHLHADGFAPR